MSQNVFCIKLFHPQVSSIHAYIFRLNEKGFLKSIGYVINTLAERPFLPYVWVGAIKMTKKAVTRQLVVFFTVISMELRVSKWCYIYFLLWYGSSTKSTGRWAICIDFNTRIIFTIQSNYSFLAIYPNRPIKLEIFSFREEGLLPSQEETNPQR